MFKPNYEALRFCYEPHHLTQDALYGRELSSSNCLSSSRTKDMFMMGKGFYRMMGGVVVSKDRVSSIILAVVPILGLDNARLGMDKLHNEELNSSGKDYLPFHKTDIRCSLFLGKGHTLYLGAGSQHLFQAQEILFD
jgi:hypothetical protein